MRVFFLMFVPIFAGTASAQGAFEHEFDADLTVVTAFSNDGDSTPETENLMAEASVSLGGAYLLDNGVEVSGRLTFRAQTDYSSRPGFAGTLIDCPPELEACPSVEGDGLRGAFSRLSSTGADMDAGGRGSLEAAYVAIDGGWGEVVFGRDQGIGQRFYEGGPTVFSLARSTNPILDPFGSSLTRTKNDISSIAEKVSYVTPRILGVRAGGSYTPDADVRSLDLDTSRRQTGILEPELGDVWEAGLQGARYLRDADLRVRASLTWSEAEVKSSVYDNVTTVSLGGEIERDDKFRIGVSYLDSDNGGLGRYDSLAAGATVWQGPWALTISADQAKDRTVRLDGHNLNIGVSRDVNDFVSFSTGYRISKTDYIDVAAGAERTLDQSGVLLEVRIRK